MLLLFRHQLLLISLYWHIIYFDESSETTSNDFPETSLDTESTLTGGEGEQLGGGVKLAEPAALNNAAAWSWAAREAAAAAAKLGKWCKAGKKFGLTVMKIN